MTLILVFLLKKYHTVLFSNVRKGGKLYSFVREAVLVVLWFL